jgi:lipid A ethanolaminephosphotransferase
MTSKLFSHATALARRPTAVLITACLWMASVGNLALWHAMSERGLLHGAMGLAFGVALMLGLAALLVTLLAPLVWRWTLKPVLALLLIVSAASSHFMLSYGVIIDPSMVVNTLQTDAREAADLFNLRLLITLLLVGIVPAVLVWRAPLHYGHWGRRLKANLLLIPAALVVAVLVLLASFQPLASSMRTHKSLRYMMNPLNTLYAVGHLATAPLQTSRGPLQPLGQDAHLSASAAPHAGQRPPLLLLVLGETARAGHFTMNGYGRATTPELAAAGVATFTNAWSCGTSTAESVPCMFSHLGRENYKGREQDFETVLDVLAHAGLGVLWVDNQAGCKGVCDRVPHISTEALPCAANEACFDEAMLGLLDAEIAKLPAAQRERGVVVVLHQMGSHGPAYHKRSPPAYKRFLPECTSNELQHCTRDEVVNAYDNSIAYTDHFLGEAMRWLTQRESTWRSAMVYVSDHGESLGENNLYLHGLPYAIAPDVQKHVPWITWLSRGFSEASGLSVGCLNGRSGERVTHDHYFHSVLGLMGVQTSVYVRGLDAYAACAKVGRVG